MVCSTPGMSEQSLILSTDNLFVVRSRSVRAAVGDRRKMIENFLASVIIYLRNIAEV